MFRSVQPRLVKSASDSRLKSTMNSSSTPASSTRSSFSSLSRKASTANMHVRFEDLCEMERRKRVQELLDSKDFCRELEHVVNQDPKVGDFAAQDLPEPSMVTSRSTFLPSSPSGLSDVVLPRSNMGSINLRSSLANAGSIVPIGDLRPVESMSMEERIARTKLASLYRLVDLFQWSQGIYNHITVRIGSADPPEILINPFGLLYHEITASSLVKINLAGDILDSGTTKMGINSAGYVLHSAIHAARPDVRCVLHMHTAVVSAVSSMKCGLLPICQEAMIIGPVAYHDYQGIVCDENERESIVRDLGDKNVMLLRNHGVVACGESIEDALHLAFHVVIACETQIRASKAGIDNLIVPDAEAVEKAYKIARRGGGGVNKTGANGDAAPKWRIGELEWEAWMRVLDAAGLRTGHIYRQPHLKHRHVYATSSLNRHGCAYPSAARSVGALDESDTEAMIAYRLALLRKEQEKAKWLNSPHNYQKVQIYESNTSNPKVITKWVQDPNQPQNGTPIKVDGVHQYTPVGTDPKEFKAKQRELKEYRRAGLMSAGPQSAVFEDVTIIDENGFVKKANGSPVRDPVHIGTASKGIIDRSQQHNAKVYRQLYAPNPFSNETDEEIRTYMRDVELKSRSASAMDRRESSPPRHYALPESPTPDTASLMQAARRGRPLKSASMDDELDNVSSAVSPQSPPLPSPPATVFRPEPDPAPTVTEFAATSTDSLLPERAASPNRSRLVTTFDEHTDYCSTAVVEGQRVFRFLLFISNLSRYLANRACITNTISFVRLFQKLRTVHSYLVSNLTDCTNILRSPSFFSPFIVLILFGHALTSRSEMTNVHALESNKDGKKKKRKGFFSFGRKKKQ
uniref:Aldolase_II domain-containing protein n=1 Tax=Panagrellus redivivus TaxID=6233 RepID=A0A7E4UN83_PANRE